MRLQQVRDWLGGQSWFDTTQYRILPPEGVSIHWSRYVDLGIAAFLVPASWFLSQTQAEHFAVILWPTVLGSLAVVMIGFANNRLFGPAAAVGALVTFLTWSKLGGEFAAGRIDHHNIQILCATVAFYLSVLPGRRGRLGVLAGAATAFSLAIGLEMLPFFAALWGMMVLRHGFAEDGIDRWLIGFCAAFAVAAPLLLAGQTPISGWWINHCDVMAPPLLALAGIGIVATLVPVVFARKLPHPVARIGVALALTGAGIWLAAPLLSPCLAGPYAATTPEVRLMIETRINEALSAGTLLYALPEVLMRVLMPALVIGLLALGAAWILRHRLPQPLRIVLIQSFVLFLIGFGFSLVQIRAANLMTPALPLLAGFLVHAFTTIPRTHRLRAPAALLLVLAIPAVHEAAAREISTPRAPTASAGPGLTTARNFCRNTTVMAEIASLPPSTVFASGNIGPAILAFTPHAITSAWYHRSTSAFLNGIKAFEDRAYLEEALARSRADYLVVCVGLAEERFVDGLANDGWPDWLVEETGDRKAVRVFRIDQAALGAVVPQ
ncbi:MAG: hypothetical protein B7Y02_06535 [Rhodobacterales bacterium 17-64-5]|nr:MAG: hypothetical protein B7Y02_06535 [Rhodobacterales bacterium 17-64-5]